MAITDEQVKAAWDAYGNCKIGSTLTVRLRAAFEAVDAAAWRPIEEWDANKDPKEIFAYALDENYNEKRFAVARYIGQNRCPECNGNWDWPWAVPITHFRPLPEPPK